MLIENVQQIRQRFPALWSELNANKSKAESSKYEVEATRNGAVTLKYTADGKQQYLHSKYNPQDEAELLIAKYDDVSEYEHLFFYGVGMGYHIESFCKRYPDKKVTIYEPEPEIVFRFLEQRAFSVIPASQLKGVYIEWDSQQLHNSLVHFVSTVRERVLLIIPPAYERMMPEQSKQFAVKFSEAIKGELSKLGTNTAFERDWTFNCMKNLPTILNTQNVVGEKKRYFADKPVILAAAGPSLADEFDNLRYIKERGLAYIFAVGSANRSLIANGIYPDAVTTYDPWTGSEGHDVFAPIVEAGITTIPMIFGSTVGHNAVSKYTGPLLHMFITQDTVSPYYLGSQEINSRTSMLSDAPSIAAVTLQLLSLLGCSDIIFVGQNLAYRNNQYYAAGIEYASRPTEMTDADNRALITIKDVEGNDVYTNDSFESFRKTIEVYIAKLPSGSRYWNTTRGGAHINGTTYMPLDELIQNQLKEQVVDPDWYKGEPTSYDWQHIRQQAREMDKGYREFDSLYDKLVQQFQKLDKQVKERNEHALARQFPQFDQMFNRLKENVFFKAFIKPMARNQEQLLIRALTDIRGTVKPLEKAPKIVEAFGKFVYFCGGEKALIDAEFVKLQQQLLQGSPHLV